jgi:diacylglycerol O-acyltransferase / wax synthase
MADHLSALDATFLELEDADPASHMHVGAILEFDGPPPALEEVRDSLRTRLAVLPRFHQRLSTPTVGTVTWPTWQDDPGFDVARHTRASALPPPGGQAELEAWAGHFWSERLDRDRPLWEMALVTGLAGDRWALATKTHHCLVDGRSTADLGPVLLDLERQPRPRPPVAAPAPLGESALAPLERLAEGVRHALGHPRDTVRRTWAMADLLVRDELRAAPASTLNATIGPRRRYAAVDARLSDLKAIKHALGGTVNDVALAICTTGLRALLAGRGEEPPEGLRAMVPVDVRADHEHLALGNRVASLFVELPVAEPDPFERYLALVADTRARKGAGQAEGSRALVDVAALAPPILHAQIARSLFGRRLFNLTITNIPGPQVPLYGFGRRMRRALPLVPIFTDHAVGIAIASFDGGVVLGINADDHVDDLDALSAGMRDGLQELLEIAGVRPVDHEPVS